MPPDPPPPALCLCERGKPCGLLAMPGDLLCPACASRCAPWASDEGGGTWPRMRREKDGTVMAGWLRLAVAVKFDRAASK
jgi:hypothetical protein